EVFEAHRVFALQALVPDRALALVEGLAILGEDLAQRLLDLLAADRGLGIGLAGVGHRLAAGATVLVAVHRGVHRDRALVEDRGELADVLLAHADALGEELRLGLGALGDELATLALEAPEELARGARAGVDEV